MLDTHKLLHCIDLYPVWLHTLFPQEKNWNILHKSTVKLTMQHGYISLHLKKSKKIIFWSFTFTARQFWRLCTRRWQIHSDLHWKKTQMPRSLVATSAPLTPFTKQTRFCADVCRCAWSKLKVSNMLSLLFCLSTLFSFSSFSLVCWFCFSCA